MLLPYLEAHFVRGPSKRFLHKMHLYFYLHNAQLKYYLQELRSEFCLHFDEQALRDQLTHGVLKTRLR